MKKILFLIATIFFVVGCGKEENKNTLYVYSWADYIPQKVYKQFEKATGIHVVEDIYSSNEEMFTKLKAGGRGYDIVIPSADYVEIMMKENMLQKLDKNKLSNLKNLDKMPLQKLQYFDPNNDYEVPYVMGPTIIAVNKKYVHDYPRDYSIYEKPELKGHMTLLDDMREVMTSALAMNDHDQTTSSEADMKQAADLVKKWKQNIIKFDAESYGKGFASGDFWVVQGYPDNVIREIAPEDRKNVDIIIPEKGGTSYVDSFVILTDAPHKSAAYKFINFIMEPKIYAEIADALETPSINVPARKLMKVKPLFNIEDLKKTQVLKDIHKTLDMQNKYWEDILISK